MKKTNVIFSTLKLTTDTYLSFGNFLSVEQLYQKRLQVLSVSVLYLSVVMLSKCWIQTSNFKKIKQCRLNIKVQNKLFVNILTFIL